MLQVTTYIEQMKDRIHQLSVNERKPNNKRWMDEDIGELTRLKFKAEYGEDLNDVHRDNERMLTLLQELTMQSERVSKLDHWIVDDFQDFYRAWNVFWKAYQQRMALLFKFREFLMKKNIDEEGMTGTSLRQVYQEANAMHQLFAKSIPVSTPFITDVDDWILFMAQLGRVHPDNKRDTGVKPFWRFLYRFFQQTYKLFLWFIFPVSIILAIAGLLSSDGLLLVGSFLLAFFLAYITDKSILESGARKRSQQQRKDRLGTQSIIQRKYQQAFSLLKQAEEEERQIEKCYEFRAKHTTLQSLLIGTGLIIFLFGIWTREVVAEYTIWYVGIGIGLIVLGIILQKWSWMNIQLWPDKIIIGKMKVPIHSIAMIEFNRRRSKIKVAMEPAINRPFVLKIPKEERLDTINYLKDWCHTNYITCILHGNKTK